MSSNGAREVCRQWVVLALGLDDDKVLFSDQFNADVARPGAHPHAICDWTGDRALGSTPHHYCADEELYPGQERSHAHYAQQRRRGVFRVTLYGDEGPELAEQLILSVHDVDVRQHLRLGGVTVFAISDIADTAQLRDAVNEPSALVDFAAIYAIERKTAVGYIDTDKVSTPLTMKQQGES